MKNLNNNKWIIACNPKKYDIENAFKDLSEIDWNQGRNIFQVGDIVFIYCSGEFGKIKYKTIVTRVNKAYNDKDIINDSKYCLSEDVGIKKESTYMRLKLLEYIDTDLLSFQALKHKGLKSQLQGPNMIGIESNWSKEDKKTYKHLLELGDYIENVFSSSSLTISDDFMTFIPNFSIGDIITNDNIREAFKCGNMSGMRRSHSTNTLVVISDHTKGFMKTNGLTASSIILVWVKQATNRLSLRKIKLC